MLADGLREEVIVALSVKDGGELMVGSTTALSSCDCLQVMRLSAMLLTADLVILIYAQAIVQRCHARCIIHACNNADLDVVLIMVIGRACLTHDGSRRRLFRTLLEQRRPRKSLVRHQNRLVQLPQRRNLRLASHCQFLNLRVVVLITSVNCLTITAFQSALSRVTWVLVGVALRQVQEILPVAGLFR